MWGSDELPAGEADDGAALDRLAYLLLDEEALLREEAAVGRDRVVC
jgi:hypothetical protein